MMISLNHTILMFVCVLSVLVATATAGAAKSEAGYSDETAHLQRPHLRAKGVSESRSSEVDTGASSSESSAPVSIFHNIFKFKTFPAILPFFDLASKDFSAYLSSSESDAASASTLSAAPAYSNYYSLSSNDDASYFEVDDDDGDLFGNYYDDDEEDDFFRDDDAYFFYGDGALDDVIDEIFGNDVWVDEMLARDDFLGADDFAIPFDDSDDTQESSGGNEVEAPCSDGMKGDDKRTDSQKSLRGATVKA